MEDSPPCIRSAVHLGALAVVEIAAPGEWMLRAVFTWMLYSTIVIATDRRVFSDLRHLSYAKKDVGHQVTQRQRKHVMTAFGSVSACDRRVSMRSLCQFVFRLHCWFGLTASAYLSVFFPTGLLAVFGFVIEADSSPQMRGSSAEAPASFGEV